MMENENRDLWEILVPTIRNNGKPIKTRFHKIWDGMVKSISGGLTIMTPAKGTWISPKGEEFNERMIPVRILCTEDEINKIVDITLKYYEQEAVLAYKISNHVILKHKND